MLGYLDKGAGPRNVDNKVLKQFFVIELYK